MAFLFLSIATAALAGLLFGFDTAVIAGVTGDLRTVMNLSPGAVGVTVSSALVGTCVGALGAGGPGDRYGSRDCLRVMALLYLISGVGAALAWDWPSLVFFRFIGGLGIGGSSVLAPVYIAEIAPPQRRGALVGLFQMNIVLGILVAYLSNYLVGGLDLGDAEWRWKLAVTAVPSAVFLILLAFIPNSPRWLAVKGRVEEAATVLRRMGAPAGDTAVRALAAGAGAAGAGQEAGRLSWRHHRRPILLAVGLALFNQFSGINAILYYLNDIFAAAGFAKVSADLQSVAVGATNLAFTGIAMTVIDRAGRRTLLLTGAVGMTLSLAAAALILSGMGSAAYLIWALLGFIASFAFSQGAVIWVYIAEIFPTAVRARGQSLGSATHWLANAFLSGVFPLVATYSKGAPFYLFAAMMALQFVVVLLFFPETKRVSLEEMAGQLES
ncbi:sugar porter family MFS transporter [Nitrospirillum pindoramense]|uniref:Sugar porter (SP) family MFS transporter n=1 Tax=Nitrospirillum amazonense TaxID=28077 RepID=A0A560H3U8_9PROT|nr:sugar porter family MFS transporter [Nitrospirillum amazonense]TWB40985.1 sugar porter (SP) family MFS transporter [Nitrospirillum amazonense]